MRQYSEAQAGTPSCVLLLGSRHTNAVEAVNAPIGSKTVTAISSQSVLKPVATSTTESAIPSAMHDAHVIRLSFRAPLRSTKSEGSTVMVARPNA